MSTPPKKPPTLEQTARRVFRSRSLPVVRPKTRDDCAEAPRPCPWMGCRYHLGLAVRRDGGLLVRKAWQRFLDGETGEPKGASCALDFAEDAALAMSDGGAPPSQRLVAKAMGVNYSAVGNAEEAGIAKFERARCALLGKLSGDDE